MATTIPCILRALGNKNPTGFTTEELIEAFIKDGYGSEKAVRRAKQVQISHEVLRNDEGYLVTIYNPYHVLNYPDLLKDVEVRAVKIARDGTPVFL